jgi:hypothetical protein
MYWMASGSKGAAEICGSSAANLPCLRLELTLAERARSFSRETA